MFDPGQIQSALGQKYSSTQKLSSAFDGWFNPGQPINPSAPPQDVKGRRFDYPNTTNLLQRPKTNEGVPFQTLRNLAEFDLIRIVIETVKAKMANLHWSIQPKLKPGEVVRAKATPPVVALEKFLLKPDGQHSWSEWIKTLLEDKYVIDAPAIYLRPNLSGGIYACEYMDGATIKVLVDKRGRTPQPPDPAYEGYLKGIVAANYTTDELIYKPANVRTNKLYGYSKLEQVLTTINIAIGRQTSQLTHYTEGNVPEAIITVPDTWSVEQIKEFQEYWDSILEGNIGKRRHAKFIPGGTQYLPTRPESGLMDQFDEWLARVLCYAFALPPLPFVKASNRSVAETDMQRSQDEGDAPEMQWIKELMDDLISRLSAQFGIPEGVEHELIWDDNPDLEAAEQSEIDLSEIKAGLKSIDEVRAQRGDDPLGMPHTIFGMGPNGFVFVRDIVQMFKDGTNSLIPIAPPGGIDPATGLPMQPPMQLGSPQGQTDPLAGISPDLLAAVGLGPPTNQEMPLSPAEHKLLRDVGLIPGGEQADPKSHPNQIRRDIGKGAALPPPPAHKAVEAKKKASKAPVHPEAKEAITHAQSVLGGP